MHIGDRIKRVRLAKGLSQKEVTINGNINKAQFSRIENGKTDPSISTVNRIAKALGVSMAELFAISEESNEVHSSDKTIMEKVSLIEQLSEPEKQAIYMILDSFLSKKKLKEALSNVLSQVD